MDIQFPPFLQKGDKVVIVSPSSKIDQQILKGAKKRMESWGLKVAIGKHAGSSSGRYAGTIKQRLKDLQDAMDDPKVKAILCSRGGYGAVHLIDKIDFTAFCEHPKWLLGFSDITALHNLFQKNGYASLHSLMARHLTVEPEDDLCANYLKDILLGNIPSYMCEKHKLNKQGTAQGVLHGGNMAVAYGLRGTPYDIPAEGTILFIEDVSERPHAIERMMYNLKLGGVLEKLSGLIIGQFTEYEEDCSLGKELYQGRRCTVRWHDCCFHRAGSVPHPAAHSAVCRSARGGKPREHVPVHRQGGAGSHRTGLCGQSLLPSLHPECRPCAAADLHHCHRAHHLRRCVRKLR